MSYIIYNIFYTMYIFIIMHLFMVSQCLTLCNQFSPPLPQKEIGTKRKEKEFQVPCDLCRSNKVY